MQQDRRLSVRKFSLFLILLLTFAYPAARAQVSVTGRITGVVVDAQGAVIPGAALTVSSPALLSPRHVVALGNGTFLVEELPLGTYEVKCSSAGFKDFVENGLVLTAGFTATLNISMPIGSSTETVDVVADPTVDVKGSSSPTTFDYALLQDVPSGRDPWSTLSQTPGVTSTQVDVGGTQSYQQSSMTVHGSKTSEQAYSFNGLNMTAPAGAGSATGFYVDYDTFQEIQVVTDAAPAEVGIGGTYINMVTKSGSNQLHGQGSVYYQTAALQAAINQPNFAGAPVSPQVGSPFDEAKDIEFNMGAPIIKNKWWAYGGYRLYFLKQRLLSVLDLNKNPGTDVNHQTNITYRNDYQVNSKNLINAQWLYNEQNRFFRRSTSYSYVDQVAAFRQIEPEYIIQGQWTYTISPNLLLDTRGGYLHEHFPERYEPGVTSTTYSVADTSLSTLKYAAQDNYLNLEDSYRYASSLSYFKSGWGGSHNFKVGGEYTHDTNITEYNVNNNENLYLNNNIPYQVNIYDTPLNGVSKYRAFALFAQDQWTIGRRLTLNFGGRFEHFNTFVPPQCDPAITVSQSIAALGLNFGSRCQNAENSVATFNNIVPRVAVSFDPGRNGKQVIRAGFNMFMINQGTALADAVNPYSALSGYTATWTDPNNDAGNTEFPQASQLSKFTQFGGIVTSVDPNLKRPYSLQANVGYQREILKNIQVGVAYYWRNTRNQVSRLNTDVTPSDYAVFKTVTNPLNNQTLTIYAPTAATVNGAQVPYANQVAYLITNIPATSANSYNGLEFTIVHRFNKRWEVQSGLTIQHESGTYTAGTSDDFNDPNLNINRNGGYLDQDSHYVFRLDGSYVAPFKITASVNYQHQTGFPILPTLAVTGLPQGSESVKLSPFGILARNDTINEANLRISRPTQFHDGKYTLEAVADLFNITNSNSATTRTASYGANYFKPSAILNPFIARFGMKFSF
jgi:hypothetical protein